MNIQGRNAVVTGAAGGIGLAVARALMDRGAALVALVDLDRSTPDVAAGLSTEMNAAGHDGQAIGFAGDVCDADFRRSVFAELEQRGGAVNICVPAAGILRDGLAVNQSRENGEVELYPEEDFLQTLQVNLVHPTYWAMETIASVARARAGRGQSRWQPEEEIEAINVLVGSVSSRGNRGQVSYSAAKSALVGVMRTLNIEGLYLGVLTRIIHPGFVDTNMVDSIDHDFFESRLKPKIGMGRKIRPDEIADIICAMIENPVLSGEVWADASLTPLA